MRLENKPIFTTVQSFKLICAQYFTQVTYLKKVCPQPSKDKKKMKELVVRMIYVEMLGQDASFAYIKAVELCASTSISQKRVGYLAGANIASRDSLVGISSALTFSFPLHYSCAVPLPATRVQIYVGEPNPARYEQQQCAGD